MMRNDAHDRYNRSDVINPILREVREVFNDCETYNAIPHCTCMRCLSQLDSLHIHLGRKAGSQPWL